MAASSLAEFRWLNNIWTPTSGAHRIPSDGTVAGFKSDVTGNLEVYNIEFLALSSEHRLSTGSIYNLYHYGLVDNGLDAAIALAGLTASLAAGGGTVIVPSGEWELSSQFLSVYDNVSYRGQGKTSTVIKQEDDTDPGTAMIKLAQPASGTAAYQSVDGCVIADMTLDGNMDSLSVASDNYGGVLIDRGTNCVVQNVRFKNIPSDALVLGGHVDGSENLVAINCDFENCGWTALRCGQATSARVANCWFKDIGGTAIEINGTSTTYAERVTVTNCHVDKSTEPTYVNTASVSGNQEGSFVELDYARNGVMVSDCVFYDSEGNDSASDFAGVSSTANTSDLHLIDNFIYGAAGAGVEVPTSSVIRGNTVENARTHGMTIHPTATSGAGVIEDTFIGDNRILNWNTEGSPSTVGSNAIYLFATGVASVFKNTQILNNLISDNRSTKIGQHGIVLEIGTDASNTVDLSNVTIDGNMCIDLAPVSSSDGHCFRLVDPGGNAPDMDQLYIGRGNHFRLNQMYDRIPLVAGSESVDVSDYIDAGHDLSVTAEVHSHAGTPGHVFGIYDDTAQTVDLTSTSGTDTSTVYWRILGSDDVF